MFTTGWVDPRFPFMMAVLISAVWLYELAFNRQQRKGTGTFIVCVPGDAQQDAAQNATINVPVPFLCWKPRSCAVVLAMLMVAYLLIVAKPSTQAFIYFQF